MSQYKYTAYFEKEVLRKRSYLKKKWCVEVVKNPIKMEKQSDNRYKFWGKINDLEGKILRVVTLDDKLTIHNAFPDRGFKQ